MESGKIVIPHKDDINTTHIIDQLKLELTSFKVKKTMAGSETYQAESAHDDTVISLCLAVKASSSYQPFESFIATEYKELTKKEKQRTNTNLIKSL